MKRFIKISCKIFSLALSPSALKVYCYLRSVCNGFGSIIVKRSTIALRCGISSLTTVSKALCELQESGLLSCNSRHGHDGYCIASEYTLSLPSGHWFRLPLHALLLPKSAFAVYAYLCRAADNASRLAFPSLSQLSTALHMARNTVIKAIAHLVEEGIIGKARKWAGKHNLYVIQTQKKRDSRLAERVSQATMIALQGHHVMISVASAKEDVKSNGLFFGRVVQKLCSSYKTLPVTTEKKKKNYPIRYLPGEESGLALGEVRPNGTATLLKVWSAAKTLLHPPKDAGQTVLRRYSLLFSMVKQGKNLYNRAKGRSVTGCELYGPLIGIMQRGMHGSFLMGLKYKKEIFSSPKGPMDDCAGSG